MELSAAALLDRAAQMPMNEHQVEAFQHVLSVAQETEDLDTEFRARLFLATLSNINEDHTSMITHFSAAVGMHDRDPVRFPGQGDSTYPDLFWLYKNALNLIISSVMFSREQITNMLDQMEEHFTRAGIPQIAIDIERRDDALLNGTVERALELQELIDASPHDDPFDDCPTCQIAGKVALSIAVGNYEEAQNLIFQIISIGPIGCVMEPETTLSAIMLRALKNGDEDFACFAQSTSAKANPEFQSLGAVGRHLEFLGVTGNHSRGLGLLTRYQHRVPADPLATHGHFQFYLGAYTLLTSTERAGYGDLIVAGSGEAFGQGEDLSVEKLKNLCLEQARQLARAYDERNGNDNFSTRFEAGVANAELELPLDIGSTNLLLKAQTALPKEPETAQEKFEFYVLTNSQGAYSDARRFKLTEAEFAQLSSYDRVKYARELTINPDTTVEGRELLIAEVRHQDFKAADFLAAKFAEPLNNPDAEEFLSEAEFVQDDLKSWVMLTQIALDDVEVRMGLNAHIDPLDILRSIIEATEGKPEFATAHRAARAGEFVYDAERDPMNISRGRYLELRAELDMNQRLNLDCMYAESTQGLGFDEGIGILDEVLGFLINAGLRETTSIMASLFVPLYEQSGNPDRAVEMARLAVAELQAAGLPSRDEELTLGIQLAQVQPMESRELLEKLLVPKFEGNQHFTALETQGLVSLGATLAIHDPDSARAVLLAARFAAAELQQFDVVMDAMGVLTDIMYSQGMLEELIDELQYALPIAQQFEDGHEAELRILDSIAIAQADLGLPEALDTLAHAKQLAESTGSLGQRLFVQESLNRTYFTFERLDDCINGCKEASEMSRENGDPSNAAAQLEQGVQYAFQLGAPERAMALLEEAFNVPGIPPQQAAFYANGLAAINEDFGNMERAQYWTEKAKELEGWLE